MDEAIEDEIDQQVLLQALLQRSEKQIEVLNNQDNSSVFDTNHFAKEESKAEVFISMAFQDVNASGSVETVQKVPPAKATSEAEREEELARSVIEDDQDDSYEELQHSLPMDFGNGNEGRKETGADHEKPDKLDQLLA